MISYFQLGYDLLKLCLREFQHRQLAITAARTLQGFWAEQIRLHWLECTDQAEAAFLPPLPFTLQNVFCQFSPQRCSPRLSDAERLVWKWCPSHTAVSRLIDNAISRLDGIDGQTHQLLVLRQERNLITISHGSKELSLSILEIEFGADLRVLLEIQPEWLILENFNHQNRLCVFADPWNMIAIAADVEVADSRAHLIWLTFRPDRVIYPQEYSIPVSSRYHRHGLLSDHGANPITFSFSGLPYELTHEDNRQRPKPCQGCSSYHGQHYGRERLVCGIHPYGPTQDVCGDWQG